MIVCSCHVVSDHEVREAMTTPDRPQTMSGVYRNLGHKPHCGRCAHTVKEIMREGHRTAAQAGHRSC